jgi:hypothetical protein
MDMGVFRTRQAMMVAAWGELFLARARDEASAQVTKAMEQMRAHAADPNLPAANRDALKRQLAQLQLEMTENPLAKLTAPSVPAPQLALCRKYFSEIDAMERWAPRIPDGVMPTGSPRPSTGGAAGRGH